MSILERKKWFLNQSIMVLFYSPSIDTGHRVLSGDWLFFFFFFFLTQSQTGSCTAPHKQQLQTAQIPVPPRPPAQEGPIKTSHITPSFRLCVPSLLRVGKRKKKKKGTPGLNQRVCTITEQWIKRKNLLTCVHFDPCGTAAVVTAPSPNPPFMYSSRTVPR